MGAPQALAVAGGGVSTHIEKVERDIEAIIATNNIAEKYRIVLSVSKIEELPFKKFDDLKSAVATGQAIVRMAPFGRGMGTNFALFASSFQKLLNTAVILMCQLPIVGVASLIFSDGWIGLIFLPAPLFGFYLTKKIYLKALFHTIGMSEIAFCFAFCSRTITVETTDGEIRSRDWDANSSEFDHGHERVAETSRANEVLSEVIVWNEEQVSSASGVLFDHLYKDSADSSKRKTPPKILVDMLHIESWPENSGVEILKFFDGLFNELSDALQSMDTARIERDLYI